jgi:hypothetical protein
VARHFPSLRLSPYASANYSEWDESWNFPFGASAELGAGLAVRPMYDGHRTHLLVSHTLGRASFTFVWAWLERAGVAVAFGF